MTKISVSPENDLNLPGAPDFISEAPKYNWQEMIQICEQMLPFWNAERSKNPPPPFVGEAFRFIDDD